jgi:hypothetical protein
MCGAIVLDGKKGRPDIHWSLLHTITLFDRIEHTQYKEKKIRNMEFIDVKAWKK